MTSRNVLKGTRINPDTILDNENFTPFVCRVAGAPVGFGLDIGRGGTELSSLRAEFRYSDVGEIPSPPCRL